MPGLITPDELPTWVPGRVTSASDGLGWKGLSLRAYDYAGQDVHIPPMRDFMVVSYRQGDTEMQRRFDGAWTRTHCAPGSISLLTRSQKSHWHWTERVNVAHVYLRAELFATIASEVMDRDVADICLRDLLNVQDPVVTAAVEAIRREADQRALGGALYAESLAAQLTVHLLRNYATVAFRDQVDRSGLTPLQRRRIVDDIEARLGETIDLESLAACVGLGVTSFARRFAKTFGCPPYAYVISRRVERARRLLAESDMALKAVAANCGFADQAHMTRVVKRGLGVTPSQYRQQSGGKTL
ncbi:MAG: AraC family transcriptional regulator [Rhodospirillales bacterium]